jgi:putative endonuclease
MDNFYVYVLHSQHFDRLYIGQTNNLKDRIKRHNNGQVPSTKPYLPWKVIYFELCTTRMEGVEREKFWKKSNNRKYLRDKYNSTR